MHRIEMILNAEQCAGHAEGWAHYVDCLAAVASGRDPGPDPWHGRTAGSISSMSPVHASPAAPSARWFRCIASPTALAGTAARWCRPGSSLVEIDLMEQPPDGTLLRLTHTGLPKFCVGESSTAGEQSYVELLTCLEMSSGQFSATGHQIQ